MKIKILICQFEYGFFPRNEIKPLAYKYPIF